MIAVIKNTFEKEYNPLKLILISKERCHIRNLKSKNKDGYFLMVWLSFISKTDICFDKDFIAFRSL